MGDEIRTEISGNDELSDEEEVLAEFLREESRLNMEIDEMLTEEEDFVFKFCMVDDGPYKDESFFKLEDLLSDEEKERDKIYKFEVYGENICTDEFNDLQHLYNLLDSDGIKKELFEVDRNSNASLFAKNINNSEINLDKLKFESRNGRLFEEEGEEDESGIKIVKVPNNARILHVPDNVKVIRESPRKDNHRL